MRRSPLVLIPALLCSLACADDGGASSGDADETGTGSSGDGDGDGSTSGDGDGDSTSGDGDGDTGMNPDLPPEPEGCVVHVKPNGNDALLGLTWVDAKATLQAGLDAAADLASDAEACAVWVAEGTYRPSADDRTASFELRANVWVYGGFSGTEWSLDQRDWVAHETILSGDIGVAGDPSDNSHHVVIAANNSRLDGFTITAGNSQDAFDRNGVGVNATQVDFTLAHSRVVANLGGRGGDGEVGTIGGQGGSGVGLFQIGGSLVIDDVEFRENVGGEGGDGTAIGGFGGEGAGVFVRDTTHVEIRGSRFIANVSGDGGQGGQLGGSAGPGAGLEVINAGEVVVRDCLFEGNVGGQGGPGSSFDASDGYGVGLQYSSSLDTGTLVLANSEFIANVGAFGAGAVINVTSTPAGLTLVNSVFRANVASQNAGGLLLGFGEGASGVLANVTATANQAPQGAGVQINPGQVEVEVEAAQVLNSVIWGNTGDFDPDLWIAGGQGLTWASVLVDHVNAGGGCPAQPTNNVVCGEVTDLDPQFVGVEDLHLQPSSPLVDAGDAALLPADAADLDDDEDLDEATPVDLDGLARVVGGEVDLGAFELP